MTPIPEDVMALAIEACSQGDNWQITVARAIMAERERFKHWVEVPPGKSVMFCDLDQPSQHWGTVAIHDAAIRKGEAC